MTRFSLAPRAAVALIITAATTRAGDLSQPGPYAAGFQTVTVTRDTGLGSGTFTALLYYPAQSAGSNAPFNASGAPYAGVAFGHGFFQATTQYDNPMAHLASHGYFVIAANSETGLFPSHQNFANDLRSSLSWFIQQNANNASPYFGAINTAALGISGHSMGGGCAILAVAADPRVKALVPLAPAETSVSAIAAAANLSCPTLYICGTQDTIVPTASNAQLMFNATPPATQLVSITGGFHCGFTDTSSIGCDSGAITRTAQQAFTNRLLTEWFNLYLKGDQSDWRGVWGPQSASTPQLQRSANAGITLSPTSQTITGTDGKPVTAPLTLETASPITLQTFVTIDDALFGATIFPDNADVSLAIPVSITLHVDFPSNPEEPLTDDILISARRLDDGATRCWATATFTRTPPPPPCPGDANNDHTVNSADLSVLLSQFGQSVTPGTGVDYNGDAQVNSADLSVLLANFGNAC